jgi:site-specific DNA-methyltransferase (adenine-specific)
MTVEYLQANQPDILEVIANLSNDAVFTPPRVVNAVLDLLPREVWTDASLRWLDPGSKTGVFPREITKRLIVGLADVIPDEAARLDHILTNMVFAIATEEITAMMSRRSLYCSKDASAEFLEVRLASADGNVWHKRVTHSFDPEGRCSECKGSQEQLLQPGRDNKAYGFIHADGRKKIDKEMDMKFDVIVGNPPYQMDAESGNRTMPIYNLFVEEAKKLAPRYMAFVIPSRWMAGGLGLTEFRAAMLTDKRIRTLVDFPVASELFPGVEIKGGVCYFLWDRDNPGACEVTIKRGDDTQGPISRQLDEFDVFIRDARSLDIIHKVLNKKELPLADVLSARTAFGVLSNFSGFRKTRRSGDVRYYATSPKGRVLAWIARSEATTNLGAIASRKAMVPEAGSDGGQKLPDVVLGQPWIAEPESICTQSFLFVCVKSQKAAESVCSYYRTRFLRFLVSLRKITQHTTSDSYAWVPQQTWDRTWTDTELYKKYGITKDEQAYIEMMVKEMPA